MKKYLTIKITEQHGELQTSCRGVVVYDDKKETEEQAIERAWLDHGGYTLGNKPEIMNNSVLPWYFSSGGEFGVNYPEKIADITKEQFDLMQKIIKPTVYELPMKEFTVTWKIEVDAQDEHEAEKYAYELMMSCDSIAPCFKVVEFGSDSDGKFIDLSENDEEEHF